MSSDIGPAQRQGKLLLPHMQQLWPNSHAHTASPAPVAASPMRHCRSGILSLVTAAIPMPKSCDNRIADTSLDAMRSIDDLSSAPSRERAA
eukprot:3542263-Pyramimonas_sp.AAC.1